MYNEREEKEIETNIISNKDVDKKREK
jgi:hypothetical protein